jgi:type IV pilus biogenesis protein CpaD/CtpE
MRQSIKLVLALAAAAGLAGCVEETATTSVPSVEEQACLRDVTRQTSNGDVALISSSFSQAGTEVVVGVGPQRARWRCIGYSDGTTAEIMSLTDEGSL